MRRHAQRGRPASAKTLRTSRRPQPARQLAPISANGREHCSRPTPCYDSARRELRVGDIVVKRFTQRSDAQEMILQAFEEENRCEVIDDPLPGKKGQDARQRLRTAIANLNRRHRAPLLQFRVRRLGTAVAWEFRQATVERQ
jgi:hypothetical protein